MMTLRKLHCESLSQARNLLGGKRERKIANNTWVIDLGADGVGFRLHNTVIVRYTLDGRCILNSGGWQTVTTKQRMNALSPARVWQKGGQWFVNVLGDSDYWYYRDGMEVPLSIGP